jgi:putative polyhydroxyalkanoate system protein
MATIDMSRQHTLGTERARERVQRALTSVGQIVGKWDGNTFRMTAPATGVLNVTDKTISVHIELFGLLAALRLVIEQRLMDALDEAVKL